MNIRDYNKIMVVGACGAGKSRLSKRIALLTGYPVYHLDAEALQPGYAILPHNEFVARQNEIISGKQWIIEGNYKRTIELRYTVADLVIFLDVWRFTRLISIARRQGTKRSDFPDYLEQQGLFSKRFAY